MVYQVKHKSFGNGIVTELKSNTIKIQFGPQTKTFQFPQAFGPFLHTDNKDLLKEIQKRKDNISKENSKIKDNVILNSLSGQSSYSKSQNRINFYNESVSNSEALLGHRAQSIHFNSVSELFECIGYIANNRHVSSFEAEVPKDGRNRLFERLFPGQKYRPIEMGYTPSGMPNKVSPQFRINFINLENCPTILRANMGKGNGGCLGRINKSRFVLNLVQHYGFKFGDRQDVECIKSLAHKSGHLREFEEGYRR